MAKKLRHAVAACCSGHRPSMMHPSCPVVISAGTSLLLARHPLQPYVCVTSRLKTGGCPVFSPVAIGATWQLGQLSYTNAASLVQLVLPNSYLGCWQDRYSRTAPRTLLSSRLESQGCTGPITRRGSELLGHGGQLSYIDPASHSGPAVPTRRLARP